MTDRDRTYEIHEVAQLTGLEPARLRAWERRYAVVRPIRQPNGYRSYTAEQVALLRSYARLIADGERIGDLVKRPVEEVIARAEGRGVADTPNGAMLDAIKALDRERLEALVTEQLAERGLYAFAHEVVLPLGQVVGDLWALGKLPVAGEHLASEVIIQELKNALRRNRTNGPLAVAACLPGERHEWGILVTLADLQQRGWRLHYLGADLPVQDALEASWRLRPRVLALSASHHSVVESAMGHLSALPGKLPPGVIPAIGGSGAEPHARLLRAFGYRIGLEAFSAA
ncbi:MAG: MerR family transcriptional regulator [Gemmatimonadota bacterium]